MLRTALALLLVIGPSCATRKEAPPAAATAGADAAAAVAAPPVTAVKSLSCEQVLPAAVLEARLPGATLASRAEAPENAVVCDVERAGVVAANLVVTCHPRMPASREASLASLRKHLRAIDLPGVGAGAVSLETAGHRSVSAWDDDSDCQVTATADSGTTEIDLVALAKDVLAALPQR